MFRAGISDPVNTVLAWYVARDAGFYAAHGVRRRARVKDDRGACCMRRQQCNEMGRARFSGAAGGILAFLKPLGLNLFLSSQQQEVRYD
jgi:hypothetical protein